MVRDSGGSSTMVLGAHHCLSMVAVGPHQWWWVLITIH